MSKSQEKLKSLVASLPESPGVYRFLGTKGELLYIGKATSLKSRVRSYFAPDIREKRSELISRMVFEARDVKFEKTDSVLEALLLEAELIKKYLPYYNTIGKDQKSWNYVVITDEKFPRVLIVRGRNLLTTDNLLLATTFGPFTNSNQLREALKIIRRIFPYRDKCVPYQKQPCFNHQIGLCPGVCVGAISESDYKKIIRNISLFFQGKKKEIIKNLNREMKLAAKNREFEKAADIKNKIFALQHIEDIALIKRDRPDFQIENSKLKIENLFRLEAYDIAHISGTSMVGVMTVVEDGVVNKNDYRTFKIRGQKGADDTRALREVLTRRFKHTEWQFPNLLVVDGGVAQINAAQDELQKLNLTIPVVSVVKDKSHKARKILPLNMLNADLIKRSHDAIILANSEAHRFALKYHKNVRGRSFL